MSDTRTTDESQSRRRPSAELAADAVIASYLHDISDRHQRGDDVGDLEPDDGERSYLQAA